MWCFLLMPVDGVAASSSVPDVPFVKREPQFFWRTFAAAHKIADRNGFGNLAIHGQIRGKILRAVSARFFRCISYVAMQRERVHVVVTLFQHLAIPLEIGGHQRAT